MLDEKFKSRMKDILGDEYCDFIDAIENSPETRAVRVNTLKASPKAFSDAGVFDITPLPYATDGFSLLGGEGIGNTPEHHAGMIYVQDAGAMATVNALDIKAGWRVLDMCSAPGGKSGQAAAKIGDGGFLLSNEYVPKRAKTVVSNFERLGVKNAAVTSLDTAELKKLFCEYFDLVIADVPCSGEGMFRKSDEALTDWSEENVRMCAERQLMILENAIPVLKAGGRLVYSTCTYSLRENEMVVATLMEKHPELRLIPVKNELLPCTKDGINFDGAHPEMSLARRFYPHVSEGEGQFVAVLKKSENAPEKKTILYKDSALSPSKAEMQIAEKFLKDVFSHVPSGRIIKQGEHLALVPHDCPIPKRSVFMPGVIIGEVQKNILKPHHQLFSAYGDRMKSILNLKKGDKRVAKYLRGEEIECDTALSGYTAVMYEGVTLGGGKASSGRLKNHYPKGLRNN